MTEPSEMLKEMVKVSTGEEPQIHEPTCVLWKADHENCKGCSSDLSCSKLCALMMATLREQMYTPKDFEDFNKTMKVTSELMRKILDAKSVDEVHSIIL